MHHKNAALKFTELRKLRAPYLTTVAIKISPITKESTSKRRVLREIKGFDFFEFFYLKMSRKDLTSVMLCMRSAEVATLHINRRKPSREVLYDPAKQESLVHSSQWKESEKSKAVIHLDPASHSRM
ncbi:hypothetical protein Glove_168g216 [Diversispora epigaea]|uniref:Uncharacterized protein n=1 Tax=Diversispora epigaea TaxID=1348612 RepID=A0A397IW29_9GLOM|nr:hypothetical protein Glove_168g216 [Diversispora epigaea]